MRSFFGGVPSSDLYIDLSIVGLGEAGAGGLNSVWLDASDWTLTFGGGCGKKKVCLGADVCVDTTEAVVAKVWVETEMVFMGGEESSTCWLESVCLDKALWNSCFRAFICEHRFSLISLTCFKISLVEKLEQLGGETHEKLFAAFKTSKLISDSIVDEGWLAGTVGAGQGVANDASFFEVRLFKFLYASSFLCFSNREHLVDRIWFCSLRCLMVTSFSIIFSLQVSRSILKFSFSNSEGLVARVAFVLLLVVLGADTLAVLGRDIDEAREVVVDVTAVEQAVDVNDLGNVDDIAKVEEMGSADGVRGVKVGASLFNSLADWGPSPDEKLPTGWIAAGDAELLVTVKVLIIPEGMESFPIPAGWKIKLGRETFPKFWKRVSGGAGGVSEQGNESIPCGWKVRVEGSASEEVFLVPGPRVEMERPETATDIGDVTPNASVLEGGDASSSEITTVWIGLFRDAIESLVQASHRQSFGWFLDLRLLEFVHFL